MEEINKIDQMYYIMMTFVVAIICGYIILGVLIEMNIDNYEKRVSEKKKMTAAPDVSSLKSSENYEKIQSLENELYLALERQKCATNSDDLQAISTEIKHIFYLSAMEGMDVGLLIEASRIGHLEVVNTVADLLIRDGLSVDYAFGDNFTALMYAAQEGQTDVVKALLKRGADVNLKNSNGETAAEHMRASSFPEISNLLKTD